MNTIDLRSEPGAPDFHRRFVLALKTLLGRPPEALVVDVAADLPRPARTGALARVRGINALVVFDGGWIRTDTGASL